jgi:hypothetical protein
MDPTLEADVHDGILASLEKRWAVADQEVFILAVFLNPYICKRCFSQSALTEAALYSMVERVFARIFGEEGDIDLLKAFTDYVKGVGEFSDDVMSLDMMAEMHKKEVRNIFSLSRNSCSHDFAQDLPLELVFVWTRIDNGKPTGRNGLVKLAIHLLSIIANSAGCERAFSNFGIIHTKPCNKLSAEKVHKTGVVKMELCRSHVEAGLTHTRRKRAFGEIDNPEEPPQSTDSPAVHTDESDLDFHAVAQALVANATAAADVDSDSSFNDPAEPLPMPSRPRNACPTQYQIIPLHKFPWEIGLYFHCQF